MKTINIQNLLNDTFVGKIISKQPKVHENYWGKVITHIFPIDLNYGMDSGYLIGTDGNGFTIRSDQDLIVE